MQQITIKTYKFDELSDKAKEKAISEFASINVDYEWWEFIYEDAEQIGLKINEFDTDRGSYVRGKMTVDFEDSLQAILTNHGDSTDTYKLAVSYQGLLTDLKRKSKLRGINESVNETYEDDLYELREDYEHDLKEEYLSLLRKEYEYLISDEAIIDTIQANEYSFLEDGSTAYKI
jgi:hypothetical protein